MQHPPKTEGAPHNAVLAFQTSWHTDTRNRIVAFWQASKGNILLARLHLAIDSLVLIPAYSLCLLGPALAILEEPCLEV